VDLVVERADHTVNLCELKCVRQVFEVTPTYRQQLEHKQEQFRAATRTRSLLLTTLITTFGAREDKNYLGVIHNQLTIDDRSLGSTRRAQRGGGWVGKEGSGAVGSRRGSTVVPPSPKAMEDKIGAWGTRRRRRGSFQENTGWWFFAGSPGSHDRIAVGTVETDWRECNES